MRDLVAALLKASNPIINVGQGVLYAEATDELVEFAELTNIPVMTTLAGKSAFPETHPLALGTAASSGTLMAARFLEKTDFVLGMGTSFTIILNNGVMTHYHDHFPHATEHWGSNKLGGDYAKVAEGLGAYAEKVDNPDEVGPAIRRALEHTKTNQPAVLEMMTKEEENVAKYW